MKEERARHKLETTRFWLASHGDYDALNKYLGQTDRTKVRTAEAQQKQGTEFRRLQAALGRFK